MRERAGQDVEGMQALIEDALDFAREGFVGDASEPVDLAQLARQEADRRQAAGGVVRLTLPAVPVMVSGRSEEHTSELQSLMRISYAVFCLKTQTTHLTPYTTDCL